MQRGESPLREWECEGHAPHAFALAFSPAGRTFTSGFIRNKQECVTPVYYTGVIALRADFDLTPGLTQGTSAALVGRAVQGSSRFAVVDWGEVLRGGLEEICFVPERGREDLILGICWV